MELTDIAPTLMELAGLPVPDTMQGRSLLPILTGRAAPDHHRDFVRCEYRDAVDVFPGLPETKPSFSGTFATMYRDRRWKLVLYHDHDLGELYDMANDPYEFNSLWDDPAHQEVKMQLLLRSHDATVRAADYGAARVMPY